MWSPQQESAIKAVRSWLADPNRKPVFRLDGYAGTGKTTLAKELVQDVKGPVFFAAYTGKAAYVLRRKGCTNAQTIHRLIYCPQEKSRSKLLDLERELQTELDANEGTDTQKTLRLRRAITQERVELSKPSFSRNDASIAQGAALIVIDEASMVDARIGQDLLSYGVPILVLGDPAQLPPVKGTGFFMQGDPDVLLTEIHRQALDNPILRLATDVREGRRLKLGQYGDSCVIQKKDLQTEDAMSAQQILVGKNMTRYRVNRRARFLLGLGPALDADLELSDPSVFPAVGDKMVCLRNDREYGLLNGSMWRVLDVGEVGPRFITMTLNTLDEESADDITVEAHSFPFLNIEDKDVSMPYWERLGAQEFTFGYGLTVHKSQGSQWDDVLLFDESRVFSRDGRKWLYTGITRAAKRVTVVKDY